MLALFGIGYYGFSFVPGLTPIDVPNLHDTIDPRQKDQTHTGLIALNDVWQVTSSQQVQLSGFFPNLQFGALFRFWRWTHPAERVPHRDGEQCDLHQ